MPPYTREIGCKWIPNKGTESDKYYLFFSSKFYFHFNSQHLCLLGGTVARKLQETTKLREMLLVQQRASDWHSAHRLCHETPCKIAL
jgi:hypothetical protein